ncbi:PREDICTED: RNA exonuclease 4-like isoform X2 [Nelumbo nucifera]|nr:PREDICTED: RNA exonuclease 4-like isoform X2 [Nelumbo nucifera]
MDLGPGEDPPKTLSVTVRHKCSACFKQYKKKEHLIEHMKVSYHSIHEPKCGACKKHCKSLESLREHLTGPLPKANCSRLFVAQGCNICLNIFESPDALNAHKEMCIFSSPAPIGPLRMPSVDSEMENSGLPSVDNTSQGPQVVAMDCEMVGGGSDGSLDLCARVCLIDENEKVIFHSFVQPLIPVTNYRYDITGLTEEHLRDAMPLNQVQEKIQEILYNGEAIWRMRMEGGKARLLVGHDLEHDLDCLRMNYPDHLLRDTAKYRPLMKTNLVSHSLKYLTKTYLGFEIQSGVHDPYEDCVAAMRLYKRMSAQDHQMEGTLTPDLTQYTQIYTKSFDSWKPKQLEKMSPDELFKISRSSYRCWCLDSRKPTES